MAAGEHVSAVLALLTAAGFIEDGTTREQTVRVPTRQAPVCGGSGGEHRTFGGRIRYILPDTDIRVTIGSRTTSIYRYDDGTITPIDLLPTRDSEGIRRVIASLTTG